MKERLLEFLRAENKSSAQFAEEIGVQPSGISHILSGRNNPSLDFVLKMLEKYKFISTDWLLFGKGLMYKDQRMQTLFTEENVLNKEADQDSVQKQPLKPGAEISEAHKDRPETVVSEKVSPVIRIVWFYADNSFEEYYPQHQQK